MTRLVGFANFCYSSFFVTFMKGFWGTSCSFLLSHLLFGRDHPIIPMTNVFGKAWNQKTGLVACFLFSKLASRHNGFFAFLHGLLGILHRQKATEIVMFPA